MSTVLPAGQAPATLRNSRLGFWFFAGTSLALVAVALLAPLLAPHDPNAGDVLQVLQPPSPEHPLGTDASGRDLLSRLIYGSRTALLGPLVVVVVAASTGTALGILGAWRRGWVDSLVGRVFDLVFSFPSMLLALLFIAVMSPGLTTAALAVSIAFVPAIGRLVRSSALREVNEPYVQALQTQGYAMVELAGVSFLGLGVQEPTADWGKMIQTGQGSIVRGYPQESLYAGIVLVVAVVCFISLGDILTARKKGRRG